MPTCPVCEQDIEADQLAFEHHVNAHFDEGGDDPGRQAESDDHDIEFLGQSVPVESEVNNCFICGTSLNGLSEGAQNAHVSACLDHQEQAFAQEERDNEDDLYDNASGDEDYSMQNGRKARLKVDGLWDGTSFAGRNGKTDGRARGDKWWDPVQGDLSSDVLPPNFSPGVIPVLHDLLLRSVERKNTRRAVLAHGAVHIKGSFGFDGTWGCGYRNAEMAIASLLLLPDSPYASLFAKKGDPGVRAIQDWIDEAWRAGYDPQGRAQLKGQIVGTSKWVGPTDLYAMFSYLGVPCTLYDFPKPADRERPVASDPEPSYAILLRWVKQYFDADEPEDDSTDALDALMHAAPAVRISNRLPLLLQHNGHSRTIVGYETDLRGDITLILFDPGKTIPKDVRDDGVNHVRRERTRSKSANGSKEVDEEPPQEGRVKMREGVEAAQPSSSDEVGPGGWVRRKVPKSRSKNSALSSSLSVFRMKPRREQKEFQVLAFLGIGILTPEERAGRRTVTSIQVDS